MPLLQIPTTQFSTTIRELNWNKVIIFACCWPDNWVDRPRDRNYKICKFKNTFDFVYRGNMLSKHHRDSSPVAKSSRWNLTKFVVIKHWGWESSNVQPSCCLDIVVYMLNYVLWRHILLEIEFKSRVDMGSDSNRYTAQRYSPWAAAQLSTPKKKIKRKQKNRARRIYNSATPYGQAE